MLYQELKKIFHPITLLAALLLGLVFYWMYIEFYVTVYPTNNGGQDGLAILEMTTDWIERYGTSLAPEEVEEIAAAIPDLYAEADSYIAAHPIAQAHGLKSYEDYQAFRHEVDISLLSQEGQSADSDSDYQDMMLLSNYLSSPEANNIAGRLYTMWLYVEWQYPAVLENPAWLVEGTELTETELGHVKETYLSEDQAWKNILPEMVGGYQPSVVAYRFTILTVLILCVLLGPVMTKDRMSRMLSLQYASCFGRRITCFQLGAAMLAAAIIATIDTALFFGLFIIKHGLSAYFSCQMYSFMMLGFFPWPNWTYGTWCIVLMLIHYAVAFAAAGLLFLISRGSSNYISMLLKVIPLFAVFDFLASRLMENAFYFKNRFYRLTSIPYTEAVITLVLLLLSLGLCIVFIRRLQRWDILTA